MSKFQLTVDQSAKGLWPWTLGALALGVLLSVLMPPLLLILVIAFSAWGLAKSGSQSPSSRRAIAADLGFGAIVVLYLVVLIIGDLVR